MLQWSVPFLCFHYIGVADLLRKKRCLTHIIFYLKKSQLFPISGCFSLVIPLENINNDACGGRLTKLSGTLSLSHLSLSPPSFPLIPTPWMQAGVHTPADSLSFRIAIPSPSLWLSPSLLSPLVDFSPLLCGTPVRKTHLSFSMFFIRLSPCVFL